MLQGKRRSSQMWRYKPKKQKLRRGVRCKLRRQRKNNRFASVLLVQSFICQFFSVGWPWCNFTTSNCTGWSNEEDTGYRFWEEKGREEAERTGREGTTSYLISWQYLCMTVAAFPYLLSWTYLCILFFPGKTSKIGRIQEKLRPDCHEPNWNCDYIPWEYGASKHI